MVEGIEGSGKSTLIAALAARLGERGYSIVATREPGGTTLGNRLRKVFVDPATTIDPLAEAFVVNASRAQHVAEIIEPALRSGRWVLCDRFTAATLAYQGFGRGVDLDTLRTLAAIATHGREPDLTLLVDLSVELSRERVQTRARESGSAADRLEREDAAFHARVREGYLQLSREDARFSVLDGTLSPHGLVEAACAVVEAKFPS